MPKDALRDVLREGRGFGRGRPVTADPHARAGASRPRAVDVTQRRVVFVNRYFHPDVSATSQMLSDIAFRLAAAGFEVHVICSRQLYEDPSAQLPKSERIRGVTVHRIWTARFGRDRLFGRAFDYVTFYAASAVLMLRLLRSSDVLVVKTDPPLLSVIGSVATRASGAVLVNWLQDVFPEVASRLEAAPLPSWLESRLCSVRDRSLAGARANVVLGARMRDYLASRGIPRERLRVLENWADGGALRPIPKERSALRATLGLMDKFVVAYSGNLGRAHEFETILDAAERLRGDPSVAFLMVGGGVKMRALAHCVDQRGLESFRFLPYQPRATLADSLSAADVHLACLLPELEGLVVPSKAYGIFAAARPTIFIGDRRGELGRLVHEAQCGIAVRCGDGAGLAAAISQLRAQPDTTRLMGTRARQLFESRYSLNGATARWIALLRELGVRAAPGDLREDWAVSEGCAARAEA
jgi:glycosyltransferase involved in cell wall biosynthesis